MAKNPSQTQGSKNGPGSVKKTAWKGINMKQKSPSRPSSVNSQESRKSNHTVTSIEKSAEASSPLSNEFETSSPNKTEQSSPTKRDAIETDLTKVRCT